MANGMFIEGRNEILKGNVLLLSDTIKAIAVASAYTVSLTTHRYLGDIASGNRLGTAATLANRNVQNGAFDCDPFSITGITGTVGAVVIYKDTGTAATSNLIAYIDTVSSGLPATLSAESLTFYPDNTGSGLFKISDSITAECISLLSFTSTTVTSATTAGLNEHVLFNASGGTFTITAPASPSRNDTFGIKNNHDTDATAITVSGNSNNIEDPAGGGATATSVSIGEANCSYVWQYDGTDWVIVP